MTAIIKDAADPDIYVSINLVLTELKDPADTRPVMLFTGWYWTKEQKLSQWISIAAGGTPREYIREGLGEEKINGLKVFHVLNGT